MKKLEATLFTSTMGALVMIAQAKDEYVRSTAVYGVGEINAPTVIVASALIALALSTFGVWSYQTRSKRI